MKRYKILLSSLLCLCALPAIAAEENSPSEPAFPSMDKSYLKQVKRYNIESVILLNNGLNKDQIRNILGNPHFNEGVFSVRQWNYVLDIKKPNVDEYMRCQLNIIFDRHGIAQKMNWKGEGCSQLTSHKDALAQNAVNVFFLFNMYKQSDLLPESQAELEKLLMTLKQYNFKDIKIVGYADELGSEKYNAQLSLLRAKTIENYLINHQISPQLIQSYGAGSDHSGATCSANMPKAQLKSCLQPNRRVQITLQ